MVTLAVPDAEHLGVLHEILRLMRSSRKHLPESKRSVPLRHSFSNSPSPSGTLIDWDTVTAALHSPEASPDWPQGS
jgi:hypothetical protein